MRQIRNIDDTERESKPQRNLEGRTCLSKTILGLCLFFIGLGTAFDLPIHAEPQHILSLTMHNQQFSAHIIGAPLKNVLTALSSHEPFRFIMKGNTNTDKISSSFSHLSFKEGLETLLLGYDYAIIQRQNGPTPQTFESPYLMEVVILSRNPTEPSSIQARPSIIYPQNTSTPPSLLQASNILKESIQTKPLEIETDNDESNFQSTIEEILQVSDPKSLALLKEIFEE